MNRRDAIRALAMVPALGWLVSAVVPATKLMNRVVIARHGRCYYIDCVSGDDHADGNIAAPWRTFQHAAQQMRAGDSLMIPARRYAGG